MSISQLYFGKNISQLTYEDVEAFFAEEQEESDKIEFKSYYLPEEKNHAEKESAIIKTICGFLNSSGGLIIWGAPIGQTQKKKKEKIFSGELSPLNILIEKDSFIRKVTDSITPAPNAIRFKMVEQTGKYIYILEIDKSPYSPHQFKNIYFMRLDGQTRQAPHHYIEALFRKVTYPDLKLTLQEIKLNQNGRNPTFTFNFTVEIMNLSQLQNERDVKLVIWTTHGNMDGTGMYASKSRFSNSGKNAIFNLTDILHYGNPIIEYLVFQISLEEINLNNILTLRLAVGGRYSPLRQSLFRIKMETEPTSSAKIDEKIEPFIEY